VDRGAAYKHLKRKHPGVAIPVTGVVRRTLPGRKGKLSKEELKARNVARKRERREQIKVRGDVDHNRPTPDDI